MLHTRTKDKRRTKPFKKTCGANCALPTKTYRTNISRNKQHELARLRSQVVGRYRVRRIHSNRQGLLQRLHPYRERPREATALQRDDQGLPSTQRNGRNRHASLGYFFRKDDRQRARRGRRRIKGERGDQKLDQRGGKRELFCTSSTRITTTCQ